MDSLTQPGASPDYRFGRAADILADDDAARAHGIEFVELTDERSVLSMRVRPEDTNGHDICHGGLLFLLGDTAAAYALNTAAAESLWVTSSSSVIFVKPATVGDRLLATCRTRWSGPGRMCVCDIDIATDDGDAVAMVQAQMLRRR